jgi:ubiquinone/menaquinone biosynthesis C-methylase UbiE
MAANKQTYLMEDPREGERLVSKVDAVQWVAKYLQTEFRDARRVLDVGCGPGVIAAEVARQFPEANVIGIDAGDPRLRKVKTNFQALPNASCSQGDAICLPFKSEAFDLIYCRFLLEYLCERQKAVAEMVRICKPGGRILLQDLDGQLVWHHPVDLQLQSVTKRVLKGLERTGFDPFVGRKLFYLMKKAGLSDVQVHVENYHLFAGRIDDKNYALWEMKLDIAISAAERILASRSSAEELKNRFLDYLLREDTLTYSVIFTVWGTKPGVN